ncbi:MAG: hypothetical protein J6A84_03510, partial [Clostridia bacterium]|nr:hypothetical protein [Clostridia bacterium]
MKHTTRKILALLLVLTMVIGMVPLAVLTIGALEDQSVSFVPAESGESAPEFTLDIRACEPTISLKGATGVLNFWTAVSKAGYNEIADALAYGAMGDATLTFGTLIATQNDYIAMNGELTHATAGTNAEDVAFDMVFNAAGDPVWYKEDADGFGYIVASKVIAADDRATDYVAVGYAKLTIDGDVYYAYASNANKTGTSLYELAIRALNDVSDERDEDHKFQIANNLYAANTVKQRKEMMPFITNVIEVKTAGDAVNNVPAAIELVTYNRHNPVYDPTVEVEIRSVCQEDLGDDNMWAQLLGQAIAIGCEPDEIDVIYAIVVDAAAGASLEDLNLVLDGMKVAGASLIEVEGEKCYLFG